MARHGKLLVTLLVTGLLAATLTAGCVNPTATQSSRTSKVTDLAVAQDSSGGARLTWNEFPVGNADAFTVYKDAVKVATVKAKRTWLDADVTPDVSVTYSVAAVMRDGTETERALPVTFTLRESLTLVQNGDLGRGFVNLTVAEVSPGLAWSRLDVRIAGKVIPQDDLAYEAENESWTHSASDDDLVDLGDVLRVYAPDKVVRNRLLEVTIAERGVILDDAILEGRPSLNLTLSQSPRNATGGLASIQVTAWAWQDAYRDVTDENPNLVPRWRDLAVYVNGTRIRYSDDHRANSWWHDTPTDEVLREGGILNLRSADHVHAGAIVTVMDDVSGFESFRLVLR